MDTCLRRHALQGGKWRYTTESGKRISDQKTVKRLDALRMPPKYSDVCFSPSDTANLQATGRDAKGRLQYRYHAAHTARSAQRKFARLLKFAKVLPKIRKDLELSGGGSSEKQQSVAQALRVLDLCHFRVGNPQYLRENESYGLSNLTTGHVQLRGKEARISFKGKTGKQNTCSIRDPQVVQFLRQRTHKHKRRVQGNEPLFSYASAHGDKRVGILPMDINVALKKYGDISAKDFRTWQANLTYARALMDQDLEAPRAGTRKDTQRRIRQALQTTAERLYHTPSVCKSNYLHAGITDLYRDNEARFSEFARAYGRLSTKASEMQKQHKMETALYNILRHLHGETTK